MSLKRLSVNAMAAVVQVLAVTASLAVMYFLMVRHLGIERVGVWSLVMSVAAVSRFGEAGLGMATMKFVSTDLSQNNPSQVRQTICSAALLVLAGTVLLSLIAYPALVWALTRLVEDASLRNEAIALLPFALIVMIQMALVAVCFGVIDAWQRTPLRSAAMIAAALLQIGLAIAWIPKFGLNGLAWVQVVHSLTALCLSAAFMFYLLRSKPGSWGLLRGSRFKDMLRFGAGLQVNTLAHILFEPTAKALITVFGGLAATGLFEVANRAVGQLKTLVVSAFQMLVPYVAGRYADNPRDFTQMARPFWRSFTLAQLLAILFLTVLLIVLPPLLDRFVDNSSQQMAWMSRLCALGWAINILCLPAYMFALAMGRVKWTVESHLTIGVLSVILGSLGGWLGQGLGVVTGVMLALALGSMTVLIRTLGQTQTPDGGMVSRDLLLLLVVNLMLIGFWHIVVFSEPATMAQSAGLLVAASIVSGIGIVGAMRFGRLGHRLRGTVLNPEIH